jgi:predicted Zn finger-like uncharacterized protein
MKISCQSCGAKYNIADEKVRGKIVKIACKKCGARIEIDGREPAEQAQDQDETRVYDNQGAMAAATADVWTVSVDDNDQREVNTDQLVQLYQQGTINGDTFVWREGMADWQTVRDVEALRDRLGGGGAPAPAAEYMPAQASNPPSNGHHSQPAPMAAAPTPYAAPQIETSQAARLGGSRRGGAVDLFGASAAAAQEEEDVATSAPQPGHMGGMPMGGMGGEQMESGKPIGARNENSVLFSLAALTASGPAPSAAVPGDDEKSGLIDIQKLAASAKPGGAKDDRAKFDDIMNLGGGGAFGSALGAPILAPPPPTAMLEAPVEERKKSPVMLIVVIGMGAAILALLLVLLLKGKEEPKTADTGKGNGLSEPTTTSKSTATTTATATDTATAAPTDTAPPESTGTGAIGTKGTTGKGTAGTAPTGKGTTTATGKGTETAPTATATGTGTSGKPCKTLEECMGNKGAATSTATTKPTSTGSDGPEFDKAAARAALSSIGYKDCGGSGTGSVVVTFSPSGSATSASVSGDFDGGVKGCVAGRFKTAKVPAFGGGPKPVSWKISF